MRTPTALAAVVLVLAGLAGCGGNSLEACDLLTDAEAEEILGVAARPGAVSDDTEGPGTNCAWISEDSSTEAQAAVYGVHILESDESDESDARADFDQTRDEASSVSMVEPVAGIGDEAYFVVYTEPNGISGTPSLPYLSVRIGGRVLDIGVYDSDERPVTIEEARERERAVAALAVEESTA